MDNSKNKPTRKAHELTSQLEEEDLWDLEDESSEEANAATTEKDAIPSKQSLTVFPAEQATETGDLFEESNSAEEKTQPSLKDLKIKAIPASKVATEEDVTSDIDPPSESSNPAEELSDKSTSDDLSQTSEEDSQPAITSLINKAGISTMEKVALSVIAIIFLGLGIWGYSFLHKQNNLGKNEVALDFPIKGQYATLSGFSTFWQTPKDRTGIKLEAQIIPAASITLADDSNTSGALRIYFYNKEKESIGDPITLPFNNGQFPNGEKNIEITATDGFHQEGDFNAYVLDHSLAWRVEVLEASNADASGSEFEQIIETIVEPLRK